MFYFKVNILFPANTSQLPHPHHYFVHFLNLPASPFMSPLSPLSPSSPYFPLIPTTSLLHPSSLTFTSPPVAFTPPSSFTATTSVPHLHCLPSSLLSLTLPYFPLDTTPSNHFLRSALLEKPRLMNQTRV